LKTKKSQLKLKNEIMEKNPNSLRTKRRNHRKQIADESNGKITFVAEARHIRRAKNRLATNINAFEIGKRCDTRTNGKGFTKPGAMKMW
jgi:erythromycin esterase-like protein